MAKKGTPLATKILTMGIIIIFLTTVMNVLQNPNHNVFSGEGVGSNFQGPTATFAGVQYNNPQGYQVRYGSGSSFSGPSAHMFNTIMDWDPDSVENGFPNIAGEETSIYIPQQTVIGGIPSWIPLNWWNTGTYIQNPVYPPYEWNITEPDGNITMFYMEQWLLRYYVSFSAEWDGYVDAGGGVHGTEIPQIALGQLDNSFRDLQVWIKIDTEPKWYIQGQGMAYFCIAKVQLAEDVKYQATSMQHGGIFDSNKGTNRGDVSVIPESQSSLVPMFSNPWGTEDVSIGTQSTSGAVQIQGHTLNPKFFRDATYIMLDFRKFGVYGGSSIPFTMLGWWVKGDTATFCFDVTVFVIGQWDVKDIQQNPSDYGRFQRTSSASDFLSWLFSAQTLSWLLPVLIFVALLFFAPWVILALIAMFRGGKK